MVKEKNKKQGGKMLELYLFFAIMTICILVIFNLFFLKNEWLKFMAKFRHNSILAKFISKSGKVKTFLKVPVNYQFKHKEGTYLVNENKAFFETPSRTPIYFYNLGSSEPLTFNEVRETINPDFLDDLLSAAKAAGATLWISKLMQFKWIIVAFFVMAGCMAYLVWKFNTLEVNVNTLIQAVNAIKSANLVG